jgi:DNA-binding NarL/FixJ family response regulator
MSKPIRVLLADDHQMLREGFKTMLRRQSELTIIAEADNGASLLTLIEETSPDIVITDIKMPILDGIEACKKISRKYPRIGVIALSTFDNDHLIIDMLDAGARGYLLKNTDKDEVLRAVKAVHDGGTYFCDSISTNFQKMLSQSRHTPYQVKELVEFTPRETEIIKLSCQEFTNKEIAGMLNLSIRTIEAHKERMQNRIEAKNMVGVIMYAIRHNIININTD